MKSILHTRLIRPKTKNIIRRNEEIQLKLKSILENKLTIVRGGAAVGKSTLISSFLEDKKDYMWFSIDSSSDDLSYFWSYVFYGLKNNIKNLDFYIDMINPLVKREDVFDLLSSLINELICDKELFIVFDDFQYIRDEFLLKTIEYFINNASDNVHFIIISRADIPMYLSDILMKGGVLDISSDDFYLSLEETSEFIKKSTNKEISDELIESIYLKSEGWIGAVKLLLTAVNNNKSVENVPKSSRLFIDYMNNEIISSLSKDEIDFLAVTSPLSYVNPEIYNSICGEEGKGEALLEELLRNNMLITVIDEDRKIYRYHNILREYLMKLFDGYEKSKKDEIITKLADFLIKDEDYDEAMGIFMNWQMYDKSLELLEGNGEKLLGMKVLNEFPLEFYAESLDLTVICMFYNYLNLDYERINVIINAVKDSVCNEDIKACVELCNNIIGNVITYDIEFNYEIIKGSYNVLTKMVYCILISYVFVLHGDCKKSLELIDLINELNLKLNNSNIYAVNQYSKAIILEKMGRLNESENVYLEIDKYLQDKKYDTCYDIFKTIGLPGVFIKQCRYKEAEELLHNAENIINQYRNRKAFASQQNNIYFNLAEVKYIEGNIDECEDLLNIIIENDKESISHVYMYSLKIMLLSLEDKIDEKEYDEFTSLYKESLKNISGINDPQISYGMVLFMKEKYDESLEIFNKIIFTSRKNKIGYYLVYALLWKVVLLDKINQLNDSNPAEDTAKSKEYTEREILNNLKEAIFYSRDDDILFPYYKNRKYLKSVIIKYRDELLKDINNKQFLSKIETLLKIKTRDSKDNKLSRDGDEVLSAREIEVLAALADGLTNKEIGQRLFISTSTVKTHIINIYSKLNVKNRVEAVNLARKMI